MPPINGMVPFEDWKSRTALTFSRRSPGTLAVDAAYQEYFTLRSEKNAEKLYFILDKYMREHGGLWSKADRNIASGDVDGGDLEDCPRARPPGAGSGQTYRHR